MVYHAPDIIAACRFCNRGRIRYGVIVLSLANYFTILRILLIPVFVAVLLSPNMEDFNGRLIAVTILLIASLTDALDGYLARVRNEVTRLGKLLDPIADKMLISAAMISIVQLGYAPAWMVVIILSREFAVSGIRLIAASEGYEISVSHYGKFKMIAQVIAVALLIYSPETEQYGIWMLYVVMVLAIISMGIYFKKFWQGMDPARQAELKRRRTFKEIRAQVVSTTRSLREYRFLKKLERKEARIKRRMEKQQSKLNKTVDRKKVHLSTMRTTSVRKHRASIRNSIHPVTHKEA